MTSELSRGVYSKNFILALGAALTAANLANAGLIGSPIAPWVSVSNGSSGYRFVPSINDFATDSPSDSSYELVSPVTQPDALPGTDIKVQELEFDPDPFVMNNILVTNTSGSTQSYTATVTLPTTFGAPNVISGNVGVTVIDGNNDGATLASIGGGTAVYQAQIDFATVQTMLSDPFTLTAGPQSLNQISASFGPTISNVPVNNNIRIQLNFTLTAGDAASILSRFDVVAVPEPATVLMAACGLAGVLLRGPRKA